MCLSLSQHQECVSPYPSTRSECSRVQGREGKRGWGFGLSQLLCLAIPPCAPKGKCRWPAAVDRPAVDPNAVDRQRIGSVTE
jgi:hypothetical protein